MNVLNVEHDAERIIEWLEAFIENDLPVPLGLLAQADALGIDITRYQ